MIKYPITAASFAAQRFDGTAPGSVMFMPAGKHTVTATRGGKVVTVEIEVTEASVALLQSDLEALQARAEKGEISRPYVDFNHKAEAAAAFPKRFFWDAQRGIMLELEWTDEGKKAIEGRSYSYLSPSFYESNGKPDGLAEPEIGALTNRPAFKQIERIAAEDAVGSQHQTKPMKLITKLVELGAITAEQSTAGDDAIVSAVETSFRSLLDKKGDTAIQARLAALEAENTRLKTEAVAAKQKRAEDLVNASGVPAKDENTRKFWIDAIVRDEESGTKALNAAFPADAKNRLTGQVIHQGGAHAGTIEERQAKAVVAARAANPGAKADVIYAQAEIIDPEAFAAEHLRAEDAAA